MKILVVDDVGYTRHFHARLLEKFGHNVLAVEGGLQALQMLKQDMSIDVVLTDLMMPGMDGVELYKNAMRIGRVCDGGNAIPPAFILMTAIHPGVNGQQRDVEKLRMAKELGFLEVLFKPVDPDQLKSAIENAMHARGKRVVDTVETIRRLRDNVDQLLAEESSEGLATFMDALRGELARLEARQ
jgi:CheY-like chemotaxis protein